jgi:hypothetical protein
MHVFQFPQRIEIWILVKDLDPINLNSGFGIFQNRTSKFDSKA